MKFRITLPITFEIELPNAETKRDARLEMEHMLREDSISLAAQKWSVTKPDKIEVEEVWN